MHARIRIHVYLHMHMYMCVEGKRKREREGESMSASGAKEEMPPVPEGAESLDVRTLEQELTDDLFLHILAEDGGPPITHL